MKLIAFPISKEKINKRALSITIAAALFLIVVAGYAWMQKAGRLPELNLGSNLQKLTAGLVKSTEKETPLGQGLALEEMEIFLPAPPAPKNKVYEQTAQSGEGITHLARRALKQYLTEKGENLNLTAEHKIFIEDYLQKQIGNRWLDLGETITFSEEIIKSAIDKSLQLTTEELENLNQFSNLVPSL